MLGIADVVAIGGFVDSIDGLRPSLGSAVGEESLMELGAGPREIMAGQMHFDGQSIDERIRNAGTLRRHELRFSGSADGARPSSSSSTIAGRDFEAIVRLGGPLANQAKYRHFI